MLLEGSARAVDAQLASALALVGGKEAGDAVWDESRSRQAEARGRVRRFAPSELGATLAGLAEAVVRPASGVAYTREASSDTVSEGQERLLRRIRAQLDPGGVLAA